MPIHRIPRARLDEDLRELRATGEHIVSMVNDGEHVVVITEFVIETRDAS